MNRRKFLSNSGAAALAIGLGEKGVSASAAFQASSAPASSKRVLLKLGCQSAPTTDAHLKYLVRYGVRHICGYPETSEGRICSTVEELSRMQELAEKNGVTVMCVGPAMSGVELYRQ